MKLDTVVGVRAERFVWNIPVLGDAGSGTQPQLVDAEEFAMAEH